MGRKPEDRVQRGAMFERPATSATGRYRAEGDVIGSREGRLLAAMDGIAKFAQGATQGDAALGDHVDLESAHSCSACRGPISLPRRLLNQAAETASRINPVNAPAYWRKSAHDLGFIPKPENISALTSKYWGPKARQLTVSFMEPATAELRARILSHMNAWTRTGCISFAETSGTGDIRISRGQGGYWSYLGTDVLHIPKNRPTMNLQGFTMNTPESEYRRVVRHETGHTLGFPHEHMRADIIARIDRDKIYRYARDTFGWDRQTVDDQILTPIDERTLMLGSTKPDQLSIMCYQLPGSVTVDGKPIVGGADIDETDYEFCSLIYPRVGSNMAVPDVVEPDDWSVDEDVLVDV
ncbi:hypothetical protein ACVITL_005739 [Rhizobium pisi]